MRIKRRRLLAGMAGSALGLWARPGLATESLLSTADPNSLFDWVCHTFFDWRAYLARDERDFVDACLRRMPSSWSEPFGSAVEYSLITFSHRIRFDGRVNSGRAAFGSIKEASRLRPSIAELVKNRGVTPGSLPHFDRAYGLGWDAWNDTLKVYMLVEDLNRVSDPELQALIGLSHESRFPFGLVSYAIRDGAVRERRIYLALREAIPARVANHPLRSSFMHTNYMVTDERGIVPQVDVHQPFDPRRLGAAAARIATVYKRGMAVSLDTFSEAASHDHTLYFG